MSKIEHNVTISLSLWNEIKDALEAGNLSDIEECSRALTQIKRLEGSSDDDEDEEEEEYVPARSNVAERDLLRSRRANARPVDGDRFYSGGEYGQITVIPNPPGRKGLDKYYENVTGGVHNRLVWSDIYHAWVERQKKRKGKANAG